MTEKVIRTPQTATRVVNRRAAIAHREQEDTVEQLLPREMKFVEYIVQGIPQGKAYIKAGYAPGKAYRVRNKPRVAAEIERRMKEIEDTVFTLIVSKAIRAIEVTDNIMEHGIQDDHVRLKAADSLLDRGGFTAKRRLEITADVKQEISVADLILGIALDDEDAPVETETVDYVVVEEAEEDSVVADSEEVDELDDALDAILKEAENAPVETPASNG